MKKIIVLFTLLLALTACTQQEVINQEYSDEEIYVEEIGESELVEEAEFVQRDETITYDNLEYGFTLTFPDKWEGYIASTREIDWGNFGKGNAIDFGFPVQDSIFNISMHLKDNWTALQAEEGPKPSYLGENDAYVFGYSLGHYVANDEMKNRRSEIDDIISTFEVL